MITGPVACVRWAPTINSMPPDTISCTSIASPGKRCASVARGTADRGRILQVQQHAAGIGFVSDRGTGDLERDGTTDTLGSCNRRVHPVDDLLPGYGHGVAREIGLRLRLRMNARPEGTRRRCSRHGPGALGQSCPAIDKMAQGADRPINGWVVRNARLHEHGLAVGGNDARHCRLGVAGDDDGAGEFRKVQADGDSDQGIDVRLRHDRLRAGVEVLTLRLSGDLDRISERCERRHDRAQRLQLLLERRQLDAPLLAVIRGDDAGASGQREDRGAVPPRQVAAGAGEGGGDVEQLLAGLDEGRAGLAQQRFPNASVAGERAGVRQCRALAGFRAAALEDHDRLFSAHLAMVSRKTGTSGTPSTKAVITLVSGSSAK